MTFFQKLSTRRFSLIKIKAIPLYKTSFGWEWDPIVLLINAEGHPTPVNSRVGVEFFYDGTTWILWLREEDVSFIE